MRSPAYVFAPLWLSCPCKSVSCTRVAQVIGHLLGSPASSPANSQLVRMAAPVGSRTLPLLCRKARRAANNADVAATIRSFLIIDLSKLGEDEVHHLTMCFWEFLPRVPQGMVGDLRFACIQGEVEEGILPEEPERSATEEPCTFSQGFFPLEDDNDDTESEDASPCNATVKVMIVIEIVYSHSRRLPELCWDAYGGLTRLGSGGACSCMKALMDMRKAFDRRRHKPFCSSGSMDMPTTLADWREFFRLYLFGPREPTQTTLQKFLRSGSRPAPGQ